MLPMMDYEAVPPVWLHARYALIAPLYSELMTNIGPGVLRITQQLLWQSIAFPEEFARAKYFLNYPQYISWRLSGHRAAEISHIAAQSHLWAPLARDFSSTVRPHGLAEIVRAVFAGRCAAWAGQARSGRLHGSLARCSGAERGP